MRAWALQLEAADEPRQWPIVVEAHGSHHPPSLYSSGAASAHFGQPLRVKIVSARGLRAADWTLKGGRSDPYCVCEIPDKPHSKFQTAVIAKTLSPVWNHEQELSGYVVGDSIKFDVYDQDRLKKDDHLGTLHLTSPQFHPDGFDGELPLRNAGKGVRAFLRVQISYGAPEAAVPVVAMPGGAMPGGLWACSICTLENPANAVVCQACDAPRQGGGGAAASPPPAPPVPSHAPSIATSIAPSVASAHHSRPASRRGSAAGAMQVLIQSARGLRAADWGGKSDPYCVCEIINKPESKIQTQVIEKSLDPVWNYAGEMLDYRPGDTLSFTVYDKDWGKTDDLLGRLTMTSSQFYPGGFEGELPLSDAGRGIRAFLKIKITPAAAGSTWDCPSCSLQNEASAPFCAVCDRPRPEQDGFQAFAGKDTFPGRTAYEMPATDLSQCKRFCRERGYGAFVVIRGMAYFRRESSAECMANLMDAREATAYVDATGTAATHMMPMRSPSASLDPTAFLSSPTGTVPLKVTILSASGLRAADWGGKSDPYCVCQIINKPQSKFQTPNIDRTLEPVWNHPGYLADYAIGDVVEFAIYDKDWGRSDDLLGKAMLTSAQILPEGFEGRLPLSDSHAGGHACVNVRVEPYEASASPASSSHPPAWEEHGQLRLTMVSARGLRAVEWALMGAKSEPYCVCEISGKPHTSQRTPVVGRTLEPVWNYTVEIPDYAGGDFLTFTVFHQGGTRGDEVLGRAVLPAAQFANGYEGELPLTDVGKGSQAFLRVSVERPKGPTLVGRGSFSGQPASTGQPAVAVTLESARGLRHSSPYCICEIPGKPYARFQTAVMDRTTNPRWNHSALVQGYSPGDSLVFTFYDSAKRGDVLGRLILTSAQFYPTGFRGELPLSDVGKGASAFVMLKVELVNPPQPWLASQHMLAGIGERRMRLAIVGARGLRNANWFSYSDSYCVCQIPGKPYSKVQTVIIKNSLDPTWNHEAEVNEYAPGDSLEFTVWNRSGSGFDEGLGRAVLSSSQFQQSGFDGEVPLLDMDRSVQTGAFLRLRLVYSQQQGVVPPSTASLQWRQPGAAKTSQVVECGLWATAASILSGVPVGLESDLRGATPAPLSTLLPGGSPPWPARGRQPAFQGPQEKRDEQDGRIVASVLDSLGEAYRDAGNIEEALVQSKKALDIRVDTFGDRHPDTAASYYSIGSALRLQDRLEEAWQCHWRALEIRRETHGDWHADTAASCTSLGAILLQQGEIDNALEYYFRALEISRATHGEKHLDTAACYNDVGAVFERKGDLGNASQNLMKALEIQRQLLGDAHPLLGDAYNNVGAVFWQLGRFDEALEHHYRAMEIRLQVLGDQHPDTALSFGNVGVILERLGRYPEALQHQQRALEIRLTALGQQHSETAASYINLGVVFERMLHFEEAIENYKKAHSIVSAAVGARHAWTEQAAQRIERCQRSWRTMQH